MSIITSNPVYPGITTVAATVAKLVRTVAQRRGERVPSRTDIKNALNEARVNVNAEWTSADIKRFIAALFPIRSASHIRRVHKNKTTAANVTRKHSNHTLPIANPRMTERVSPVSHLVSIDSTDRNKERFPHPNQFTVQLGMNDGSGLMRAFVDVQLIELVSVIVPQHTVDGDNVDDFPFLLLEIPEIGGIYEGTSMQTTRAFAKLRFADDLGAYREYRTTDSGERFLKRFSPVRSLDRITIRFLRPDGTLYDFGTRVKRRPRYATIVDEKEKETPMYFDGECWLPVHTDGTPLQQEDNNIDTTSQPNVLDHLPLSECAIVLRVTCLEMQMETSHLHRQ